MTSEELLHQFAASDRDVIFEPRTVLVFAHPDDEVVSAGSRLPRLADPILIHVTDGAPHDMRDAWACGFATRAEYARARRQELEAVLDRVGIPRERAWELGCADQDASRRLVSLARRLADLFRDLEPEVVVTHSYEGGHPDHDATAFAVHSACRLLESWNVRPPLLLDATSYHLWEGKMATYRFLPETGDAGVVAALHPAEQALKQCLLECYVTQQATLAQFSVEQERFRIAPRYDFTLPPHPGRLFYEQFDWGMTGVEFRRLAHQAEVALAQRELLWR